MAALDGAASADSDARMRRYYYLYLPRHLAEAGERDRLDALLLDPGWLQAKLKATASPYALFADYQLYGVGEAQSLIGRTLQLISGICTRDPRQLPLQLAERLNGCGAIAATGFVEKARRLLPHPAIVHVSPSLNPPGTEIARFEGHSGMVLALCLLPDGQLASGSTDGTIRLWDVATGAEMARLDGQGGSVRALGLLADGRLASGSDDGTIRLWDVARVNATRLEGPSSAISALCLLPDGRLASGSTDTTIRLWDPVTGVETARLEGHTEDVNTLCLLADGRLASASYDGTIRLWDVAAEAETARLGRGATALCPLSDGLLASGCSDGTVWLWDVAARAEIVHIETQGGWVRALCRLKDGRRAFDCSDGAIRLWDASAGVKIVRLEGQPNWRAFPSGGALCQLNDGRLASARFDDSTIQLWDLVSGAETARLEGHDGPLAALCLLSDGRLVSGSDDRTIRLWDVARRAETARLELDGSIKALIAIATKRFVAGDGLGGLHWLEVVD